MGSAVIVDDKVGHIASIENLKSKPYPECEDN